MSQATAIRSGLISLGVLLLGYVIFLISTLYSGSPNSTDNTSNTRSGTISSGSVATGNTQPSQSTNSSQTGSISVMIPGFLNNNFLETLTTSDTLKNINVTFITMTGLEDFKKELQKTAIAADIILIPSQRWFSLQDKALKLQVDTDLQEFLHPSVRMLMADPQGTFIPYGIDLMTLYSDPQVHDFQAVRSLSDLIKSIQTHTKTKRNQILFGRGMSQDDLRLLKTDKEVSQDYFQFLYEIVRQSVLGKDIKSLQMLIDAIRFPSRRSAPGLVKQAKQLQDKIPVCSEFMIICGLSNGWIAGSFGRFSDQNIRERYFEARGQVSVKDILIQPFPGATESVAGRAWGFVILKNSKNTAQAAKFINAYLAQATQYQTPSDEYLLSPFLQTFTLQIANKRFAPRQDAQGDLHIITAGRELQKTFWENTPIEQLLLGKYNIAEFLQNPQWKFE